MKHFLVIALVIGSASGLLFFPRSAEAISILKPFGGKIISITPVLNPLCPANAGFLITIGPLPMPIIATALTISPPLVMGGVAKPGSWVIGIATPAVATCLPIITLIGVSSGL